MTTWDEWYAHLDDRLQNHESQLPAVQEFIRGVEQSRADLGLVSERSSSPALADLSALVLFVSCLEDTANASHYRSASQLFAQGRGTEWMAVAIPNSSEIRVARRVMTAAARTKRS